MTKKKSNRGRKASSVGVDDVASLSSIPSVDDSTSSETDAFGTILDRLCQSKEATKTEALRGLQHLMASYVLLEECAARETTLSMAFSRSIKRGRRDSPYLAARCYGLLVLTLGECDSALSVWEAIQKDLIPKSLLGKSVDMRCASLEAIALGCFIVEDDFFRIQTTMQEIRELWKDKNPAVVTTAIRSWTLVLSSFTPPMIATAKFDEEIVTLRALLESDDTETQEAAGIGLAMLYVLGIGVEVEDEQSEDGSDSASVITAASQLDEMRDRMRDLSTARGPRKGKKERAAQKARFRNICSFCDDGVVRESKINLQHGDVLILTSLPQHVQMEFFKDILKTGFRRHLHENPFFHILFNFRPKMATEKITMTAQEKRYHKSPSSWSTKLRKQTRGWERSNKELYLHNGNVCDFFL